MLERFTPPSGQEKDLTRAQEFADQHVREYSESDFRDYTHGVIDEWKQLYESERAEGRSARPMWLRRNNGGGTFFGAVVDYIRPAKGGPRLYAMIDIHSDGGPTEIQLHMPSPDRTGGTITVLSEPYNLGSLDRVIEFVDDYYKDW